MFKLFIIVNVDDFFLSHRQEIAVAALNAGYDVTIIAKDTGKSAIIKSLGLKYFDLPINKSGINIFEEYKTFKFLYKLFKQERPDIVHLVGMKTILWGGIAARLLNIKGTVSAISGLGVMFSDDYDKKSIAKGVLKLMKFIHYHRNAYCIFHNLEDQDMFLQKKLAYADRCYRTMGSGIDLEKYQYTPETDSNPVKIIFTARMVEDKGVLTLIEAANILRVDYSDKAEFILCGGLETNPKAITKERLESLCDGKYIKWLGKRSDVISLLRMSHIFAFPSYYKEGLPKSCIEAAAIGRPIITCDSTGCRDTVIDGETGFLIPVKDSIVLADKIKFLIDNPDIRKNMGRKARKFAEKNFSIKNVIDTHLTIYNAIVNKHTN